jgi:hypothetical protein
MCIRRPQFHVRTVKSGNDLGAPIGDTHKVYLVICHKVFNGAVRLVEPPHLRASWGERSGTLFRSGEHCPYDS